MGLRCSSAIVVLHSLFNSILLRWKFSSMLWRCTPPFVFMGNSVRVVGNVIQSWYFILGLSLAPPCFDSICCISHLYIIYNMPLSLRAFISCSLIYLRYAFLVRKLII